LERVDRFASDAGFERLVVQGTEFPHLVYRKESNVNDREWHVYIENDGRPWTDPDTIARDPTPRRPLALRLMTRDTSAAIYLGRPCYFGVRSDNCTADLWTSARYSERVVTSMAQALENALPGDAEAIVLIGHSGGGTLAWLLAARVPKVRAVVTIAANLDLAAWAAHHGYTPLRASLDPAVLSDLPAGITELHYTGGRDTRVPAGLSAGFVRAHPHARFVHFPDSDHECCWESTWPEILQALPAPPIGSAEESDR
jgi:pimeloyl-ACP methyl ester carboxylesterase